MKRKLLLCFIACWSGVFALFDEGLCAGPAWSSVPAIMRTSIDEKLAGMGPPRLDRLYNVRDWGARGDGIADDRSAIQTAFDEIPEQSILLFPEGTYRFGGSLSIRKSNTVLWGYGATLVAAEADDASISLAGSRTSALGFELTTRAQQRSQRALTIRLILRGEWNQAIENHIIGGASAGIAVMRGSNFRIYGNVIEKTLADGIHINWGAHDGVVSKNVVRDTGDDMIAVVSFGVDNLVSNVVIENNLAESGPWGRGIAVVGGRNITIRGNTIRRINHASAIRIAREPQYGTAGSHNILVDRNTISDVQTGGYMLEKAKGRPTGQGAIEIYGYDNGEPQFEVRDVAIIMNEISDVGSNGVRIIGKGICKIELRGNAFHRIAKTLLVTFDTACSNSLVSCRGNSLDGVLQARPSDHCGEVHVDASGATLGSLLANSPH